MPRRNLPIPELTAITGAARGPRLSLRLRTHDDEPFIERVFRSTLCLPDEIAALQYRAFAADRQENYPGLVTEIILWGTEPAGYLSFREAETEVIQLVDIAVAGDFRNRGIASVVLAIKLREWHARYSNIVLHVACHNPAYRLYERLGFTIAAEEGPFLRMEHRSLALDS